MANGRGADLKDRLRRIRPDRAWADDLARVRGILEIDARG
ncbi:hypothetical protein BH24ACT7_BH24ACT7_24780 [soil metagenome]